MKRCLVLLLWGILVVVHAQDSNSLSAAPCDVYANLSQAWRHGLSSSHYFLETPHDDSFMVSKWWRFVGVGGDMVIPVCKTVSTGDLYSIGIDPNQMPSSQSVTTTVTANTYKGSMCVPTSFSVDVVLCPGDFYIYKPLSHPASSGYSTCHSVCRADSCGPHAECFRLFEVGFCKCLPGYAMESKLRPPDDVLCIDVDECENKNLCKNGNCTNTDGGFNCSCLTGFEPKYPTRPWSASNQCTDIDECLNLEPPCDENSACVNTEGSFTCVCNPGFYADHPACKDIDECLDEAVCGPDATCSNTIGLYTCACEGGYRGTDPAHQPSPTNICIDIDECLNATACDENSACVNTEGSFTCVCNPGFYADHPACKDIDECLDEAVCGPDATCSNTIGLYTCACEGGYRGTDPAHQPSPTNICIDINECVENITICGSNQDCTNTDGSFFCTCISGYRMNTNLIGSSAPCLDIDECSETPDICGPKSFCVNKPGTFTCACSDRFYSSTGIEWTAETVCESIPDILKKNENSKEKTKEKAFFAKMDKQLKETEGESLQEAIVTNCFSASMEVAGVGPFVDPPKVSSAGDGETGSIILDLSERLIGGLLQNNKGSSKVKMKSSTLDFEAAMFSPEDYKPKNFSLTVGGISMEINVEDVANNNNDFAAVSLMKLSGLQSLLSHQYFKTENATQFAADVFSAFLPTMNNTNLTEPVNFTILHEEMLPDDGQMSCIYWAMNKAVWEESEDDKGLSASGFWSEEGCWVSFTSENYTVCSCSHLSTFALIMQIGDPPPQSDFLDWLNRICVIVGLFFFALAVLTFLLCSWNPKINNTARLHLCLNLGLSHLLLLFNENFYADKLACKAIAGVLHFLVVSSFVWMLLEAGQLYILVYRLNKVQVIQRDGLPKLALFFIGYGVPLVVVGVSALVYNPGYGAIDAKVCWLSTTRNFNWALTGPVVTVLALNLILFCATLWILRTTLANMRTGASNSKDARLVLFKIVAQFVILGCTWILGLFQSNLFFQVLFIILNSQQGTLLFIVHVWLNQEIREECLKYLSCGRSRKKDKTDGVRNTEDLDSDK